MTKTLIVVGGGGHAKVLIDAIRSGAEYDLVGIVDARLPVGHRVLDVPVIGSDDLLLRGEPPRSVLALGVGSIRGGDRRKRLHDRFRELAYEFPVIRHARATVGPGVRLGDGTQVMAGAVVQPDTSLGPNCIVNTAAVIEHDCTIAGHCQAAPGAVLGGGVVVGECSFIGLGARVLPGIRIGCHVTVGAGAVVVHDVEDGATVVGVPARRTLNSGTGASMKLEGAVAAPLAVGSRRGELTLGPGSFFDKRVFDPERIDEFLSGFAPLR